MYKVLIVDDAKLMRSMVKGALETHGNYTVLEAENGDAAIELYKVTKPDLVTMDITMDIKNGVDAAKEILKFDPDARIIMITALGQETFLKECIGAGVKDFIVKPFTTERIVSAVSKILSE
ncbi:MAG: response regulator [bacterium]|nr:response regulator [bacterium]